MTKTKGTKEWAYKNLNICYGCKNACVYCYAKAMAKRFKRIEEEEEWKEWEINLSKLMKGYLKLKNPNPELYDYMFPTSHDIFPEILEECIFVLEKVLKAGNSVLITTKPSLECVREICKEFKEYKDQICFRFTITSLDNEVLRTYELEAPLFNERKDSLKHAFREGFKTSLSIEPFLDGNPLYLIHDLEEWVNDTIWVGKMSGKVPNELKSNYTKTNLKRVYATCKGSKAREKIRWKDSIVNALGLEDNTLD